MAASAETHARALAEATSRRVVAYDRLGFGQSDPRCGAMPLDFIADEAQRVFPVVLDQFGGWWTRRRMAREA